MKKSSKKSSNSSASYHRMSIQLPDAVDMDSLSYFSDDELDRRMSTLVAAREEAIRHDYDSYPWDVEVCYAQREMRIRNARRAAHDRYLRINPDPSAGFTAEDPEASN